MSDRAEMIARLQVYIETIDEHMAVITRMHEDGVLPDDSYEREIALFAGERDAMAETLELLIRRMQGG